MSTSAYGPLTNSSDSLDTAIPVKDSVSSQSPSVAMNNSSGDTLKKRYIEIAFAVALYWYAEKLIRFFNLFLYSSHLFIGLFRSVWSS